MDRDPEGSRLIQYAEAIGGTDRCVYCGTFIIDADDFANAAIRRYKLRAKRTDEIGERLRNAVKSLGVESGSWGSAAVCSHCKFLLSKDDEALRHTAMI